MPGNIDTVIPAVLLLIVFIFIYWLNIQCHKFNKADWGNVWLNRLDGLIRIFCIKYHRMADSCIKLPEKGSVILISNHVSGLDPLLLITACDRPIRFVIAKAEYERFGLKWLFKAAGCIPVDRNGRTEGGLKEAIRKLNDGEVVTIFPYGGIHVDENALPKFKRGAVLLAKSTNTVIYPVKLQGIAGLGHTLLAVPMRSNARLHQFDSVSCENIGNIDCIDLLDGVLRQQIS